MPSSNGHARAEDGKSHHEGWDEALDRIASPGLALDRKAA